MIGVDPISLALAFIFGAIDPTIGVIVSVILSGSIVGAIAAFKKAGPEAGAIAAETLIKVNEELRKELSRRALEHTAELGQRDEQIAQLRERVAVLERRLDEKNGRRPA